MIGLTTALIMGAIGAGGSVAGAVIGSKAAKKAADVQAQAAREATQLARDQFEAEQRNLKPWLETGTESLYQLRDLTRPGGKLSEGFDQPFDESAVKFDPGFDLRMQKSQQALERWAASKGQFFSGGTGKKLVRQAQEMTSDEYGNAWNRAFAKWDAAKGAFRERQSDVFNRLATMAGFGSAATADLSSAGRFATSAQTSALESGAAARAAGGVGAANAWAGGLQGGVNALQGILTLSQLMRPNYARTGPSDAALAGQIG